MQDDFNSEASRMTVNEDGDKLWRKNGQLHRDGGPAVERLDGTKAWFRNGQLDRDDGPAVERPDGSIEWWKKGKHIASFTAEDVSVYVAACEEKRAFDKKREIEQTVGSMREGLPQPITVARPLRFRR